jgi:hypothetical protein
LRTTLGHDHAAEGGGVNGLANDAEVGEDVAGGRNAESEIEPLNEVCQIVNFKNINGVTRPTATCLNPIQESNAVGSVKVLR